MKFVWIIFGSVMVLLLAFGLWQKDNIKHEKLASDMPQTYTDNSRNGGINPEKNNNFLERIINKTKNKEALTVPKPLLADSIVSYGLSLTGTPYLPAGITCEGFDCSGFVFHIFDKYGIKLPHSSAMLQEQGTQVPIEEAQKGDLIIFTGTDENDRTPGHVGVVITNKGEPIEFVHASSATRQGGVKVSKVDSTGYAARFLQVRRVL